MATNAPDPVRQTLSYYDSHAERISRESASGRDREALSTVLSLLPKPARVLDAGCGAGFDAAWFSDQGCEVEAFDGSAQMVSLASRWGFPVEQRDLRLLNLRKESYDAIWCHRAMVHLSIDDCHRVLGSFFRALKPRTGVLFLSVLEGSGTFEDPVMFYRYPELGLLSLLKQTGFQVVMQGSRKEGDRNWLAVIARRV